MYKVIKSSECKTGNLSIHQQNFMNALNLTPEFDEGDKAWKLIKVMHTDTPCIPWLIQIEEIYYIAISAPPAPRGSYQTSFYTSNKRGQYSISTKNMVKRLKFYVDLEAACDEFAAGIFREKIENKQIEEDNEILIDLAIEDKEANA